MNVSFDYQKGDEIYFGQQDMSIYSTYLTVRDKENNYVEIFMSIKDAQEFIDKFQEELSEYRDNHYWWKDNWNK